MIGSRVRSDAGLPTMTWAPVARASSSSEWLSSGSMTTIRLGRPVSASRCSKGMVSGSSPVKMVASLTNRARNRAIGSRHSTATATSAPISVAPRQTICASCKASGGCPGQALVGYAVGGFPVNRPSTPATTDVPVSPPRHGARDDVPSAAPTATMATTAINPVNRPCTRRGHQNAVQVANPTSTATSNVMSLRGAKIRPPPDVADCEPPGVMRSDPSPPAEVSGDGEPGERGNDPDQQRV